MKALCQICGEPFAEVSLSTLAYPLRGEMFLSADIPHGLPAPFTPGAEWLDMRCLYGPHRPLAKPTEILTDQGTIMVKPGLSPALWIDYAPPVGRDGIMDRTIVMGEVEAERKVRAEIEGYGKTEIRQGEQKDQKPVEGKKKARRR